MLVKYLPKRSTFSLLIKRYNHCQDVNAQHNCHQLKLRSTFQKQNHVLNLLSNQQSSSSSLNLYCCGPTVYDHSHLGHAITYIRCDLIVKMLRQFFNSNIYFAMNITDIDDKIIKKSNENNVDYRQLSNEYYQSFIEDMNSLRITPPDYYGKVSDNIIVICDYIRRIYDKGYAYYSNETGDINFNFEKFINDYSIKNLPNFGGNQWTQKSTGKHSPRDFTLWKSSKPNEPFWQLNLSENIKINGRPGWHVECSAISNSIFGDKIDLHFGGIDLMFPHHHCESCCCHAYQYEPRTSANQNGYHELYSNVDVWLHSGHLILRSEKMSKSLGNVILIKDFLKKYSTNILRLLCIRTHYRSEIDFDEKILIEMQSFDEKLREFLRQLEWIIYKLSTTTTTSIMNQNLLISPMIITDVDNVDNEMIDTSIINNLSLEKWIDKIENEIYAGLLDDMDMNRSLNIIIKFSKIFPNAIQYWIDTNSTDESNQQKLLFNCIRLRKLLQKWFDATSLDYVSNEKSSSSSIISSDQMAIVEHLSEFRRNIRQSTLIMMKSMKNIADNPATIDQQKNEMIKILEQCDQTRTFLEKYGFKLKDQRS